MPMNVTYKYAEAEKKYHAAQTIAEKISALEEMLSAIPKHKGTENQRALLKTRLSKLRSKQELERSRKTGGRQAGIKKEGAAQIVIVGQPSCGKSTFISRLTNAKPKIAGYHFTTLSPTAGMFGYEGSSIQLVEVPGLIEGAHKGRGRGSEYLSVVRNADSLIIMLDLEEDPVRQARLLVDELRHAGIRLNQKRPDVKVEKKAKGGLELFGARNVAGSSEEELKTLLREMGFLNAAVMIRSKTNPEGFVEALDESIVFKPAIILANKLESSLAEKNLAEIKKEFSKDFPVYSCSLLKEKLGDLKERVFELGNIIRVYTKPVSGEADYEEPLVLRKGSTVLDAAKKIHKDFVHSLKYARVWGSGKFPGQRVNKTYVLRDKDVVEYHA